jgi:hypothetical protein
MKAGLNCVMCADMHLDENAFSHKVAEFEHTYVRLPKNQYVRGWTILALKRHANELFELTDPELAAFWQDVARVAEARSTVNAVQPCVVFVFFFCRSASRSESPARKGGWVTTAPGEGVSFMRRRFFGSAALGVALASGGNAKSLWWSEPPAAAPTLETS